MISSPPPSFAGPSHERPVFCGTSGRRFFGVGTNCPQCEELEAEARKESKRDLRRTTPKAIR
jgi:hypothetical protein